MGFNDNSQQSMEMKTLKFSIVTLSDLERNTKKEVLGMIEMSDSDAEDESRR